MKSRFYILLLASGFGLLSCAQKELPKEYTDEVNVFIGTGGMDIPSRGQQCLMEWYS